MSTVLANRDLKQEDVEMTAEMFTVYCWRHEQLMRVGYPLVAATRIASRFDIDLHEAVELIKQGCSTDVAVRILL